MAKPIKIKAKKKVASKSKVKPSVAPKAKVKPEKPTKEQIAAAEKEHQEKAVREISPELALRVLEVVDQGLCGGIGEQVPGFLCVEAAVCFAMGEEHTDEPSCVGNFVRESKITLNDMKWKNNKARAKGLRRVAIAQLGSIDIDENNFIKLLARELMATMIAPELAKSRNAEVKRMAKRLIKATLKEQLAICREVEELEDMSFSSKKKTLHYHVIKMRAGKVMLTDWYDAASDDYTFEPETLIGSVEFLFTDKHDAPAYQKGLLKIAAAIEKALVICKSPGVKFLKLVK